MLFWKRRRSKGILTYRGEGREGNMGRGSSVSTDPAWEAAGAGKSEDRASP